MHPLVPLFKTLYNMHFIFRVNGVYFYIVFYINKGTTIQPRIKNVANYYNFQQNQVVPFDAKRVQPRV